MVMTTMQKFNVIFRNTSQWCISVHGLLLLWCALQAFAPTKMENIYRNFGIEKQRVEYVHCIGIALALPDAAVTPDHIHIFYAFLVFGFAPIDQSVIQSCWQNNNSNNNNHYECSVQRWKCRALLNFLPFLSPNDDCYFAYGRDK